MDDLQFLKAVRAKLDTPEKWIQGYYVLGHRKAHKLYDADLHSVATTALACCLAGAAMSVDGEFSNKERERAPVTRLSELLGFRHVNDMVQWNDDKNRTHAQVLGWIDDAIARVEKRRA